MSVKQSVAIGLGCFLIGVASARWTTSPRVAEPAVPPERLIEENIGLKDRLSRLLEERIPTLEAELAAVRATRKEAAEPAPKGESPTVDPAAKATVKTSADVGRVLGLEPARQKYFEEVYERARSKLLELELRHATITRQGSQVEITIPPFPDEGAALRQEWSNLLNSALTSSEQERYRTLQLDQVLFPREIGLWDRRMVFEDEQGAVWPKLVDGNRLWPTYYERWTKPGEQAIDPATRWPWSGPEAYRWYRHLAGP